MKDTQKFTKSKIFLIVFNCMLCLAIIVSSMMIVIDKSRLKNGVVYTEPGAGAADTGSNAESAGSQQNSEVSARLMCAGNNLIYRSIYAQANERADGYGYDFSYAYDAVKDIVGKSDIAFLNQETIIDTNSYPSSDPFFNSPKQLSDAMIDVGFNIFNQATDHALDMGVSGALADLELFKSKNNIMLTGLYENEADMFSPQTVDVNGVSFSFVGFTEGLNGLSVPSDSDLGLLYLTDDRSTQEELYGKMKRMIEIAKKSSDVVCVSMHWQTDDNSTEPSETQREICAKLLEYGADIIIGTGPHSLQPMEYIENGDGEQALVIWSLGNFISCDDTSEGLLGGIADITVKKNLATGKMQIGVKLIPTITHYEEAYGNVRIVPLAEYTSELADEHGIDSTRFTKDFINEFYTDMFGDKLETSVK